jgi:putative nucleotidyltransferase with HDIG domain
MSAASMINGVLRREQNRVHWVAYYTSFVSLCGFVVVIAAVTRYHSEWGALALFAAAAVIAQLTTVELFTSSRSSVSVGTIVTTATMAILGAWGAILISLMSGLTTIVTTSAWFSRKSDTQNRAGWGRRATFNIGKQVLATASGAVIYLWSNALLQAESGPWLILSLAFFVVTYETIDTLLLMIVIHLQTGRKLQTIWQQDWQWALPITLVGRAIGRSGIAFAYQTTGIIGLGIFMLPVVATSYAFRLYVKQTHIYVEQLEEANSQLEKANLGLLQTLSAVVDAYDLYTYGHSAQVARYACAIAESMGLNKEEQARLLRGGLIHDLGKVGVTDAIIGKTGRLTDEEYDALKLHTVIGAEIVGQMPQFQELVPLVRNHHERWDGGGYPDGLRGEENTLGARIMCLADSVEAMLSDRPYQSTRSLAEVITEVKRCSGTQFDPQVVEAFLDVAQKQGESFFINSASTIARELEKTGILDTLDGRCYVKKSIISLHLKHANLA